MIAVRCPSGAFSRSHRSRGGRHDRPRRSNRSAALLVRVWLEDDDSLRARLSAAIPVGGTEPHEVSTAASVADLLAAVTVWLDTFVRDGRNTYQRSEWP